MACEIRAFIDRLYWERFGKEKLRIKSIYYLFSIRTPVSSLELLFVVIPLSLSFGRFWGKLSYPITCFENFQLIKICTRKRFKNHQKAKGQDVQDFRQYLRENIVREWLQSGGQRSEWQNSFPVVMNIWKPSTVWWLSLSTTVLHFTFTVVKQKGKAWYRKLTGSEKT